MWLYYQATDYSRYPIGVQPRVEYYRSFRDPVHGFIPVTKAECEIIDTWPFQRLRRIKQLGMTYLVYHGAEHTRFGHSLGVMHQATRVFDALMTKKRKELDWLDEEVARLRQLLRIACLCHDLGHTPFSHAGEDRDLLPDGLKHDDYSAAIVLATDGEAGEVGRAIQEHSSKLGGISRQDVADLITGQSLGGGAAFLREIVSGELDADRMDYLQRDSIYCGVGYGRFDNERLIETLTLAEDRVGGSPVIAIEKDGVHAVEGLTMARYYMFSQVYFHRVRRAYDHHLRCFLKEALPGQRYPKPDDLERFLSFDDVSVQDMLGKVGSEHGRRILERNHYRVAYETGEHPSQRQIDRWNKQLFPRVREEFPDKVASDSAETASEGFSTKDREFPVVQRDPSEPTRSVEEESDLIRSLKSLPLTKIRLLADRSLCAKVKRYCDSLGLDVGQ